MSVRQTNRKLTGRVRKYAPEIILGYRTDGAPGVTVSFDWETYGCYDNPTIIMQMITDLSYAYQHLMSQYDGPPVS